MENVLKNKFVPSSDKLNNNEKYCEDDFESSNKCVSNSVKSKYFQSIKMTQGDSQKKEAESKILSVLDPYCKTNILDESSDFIELENKFKSSNESVKSSQIEKIFCEICKDDITNLDEYNRAVHVNSCIDKQISNAPEPHTQPPESDVVFILECPLCFKHFPSPELRSNHIKKCGKSKGLSLQSILKALQLQERHALERISLGLPVKPVKPTKSHKSAVIKKAIVEPKNKAQSDLQLAKALSLSLKDSRKQDEGTTSENITFVTLKPPTAHQQPGKKTKTNVTPLLVLRTDEERKKLLLDKVATIITPKGISEKDLPLETEKILSEKENENPDKLSLLWQLSGKAVEKNDYYVENLLDWIQPSEAEVGANLCHLSQIAGHEIVTQLPCDYTFNSQNSEKQTFLESSEPVDSVTSLTDSLRSLVASSWMSDVDIETACGTVIPAHRLLLALRCSPLKQDLDFCSKIGRVSLKWESTSFDAALQFLNFLYTGKIEVEENMKADLLHLANKYEVSDLRELLFTNEQVKIDSQVDDESVPENLPFACDARSMQMDVDANEEESVDHNPENFMHETPPCSQSQAVGEENGTFSETQDDCNMDLDIVCNCINSSLKPSQPHVNSPFRHSPTIYSPSKSRICSQHSSDLDCHESKSCPNSSKTCTVYNCALPEHKSPTSPVIFDVIDSESESEKEIDINSDNESVELPVNCSQKSVLERSNLVEMKLDLCSNESNSSQDSVKFLSSSISLHNSLTNTPVKEKIESAPLLPKFSLSPVGKISSPLSELRDSQKSFAECSPVRENIASVSLLPKFSLSPVGKISSPLSEIRDSQKSFAECSPVEEKISLVSPLPKFSLSPVGKTSLSLSEIRDSQKSFAECRRATVDDSMSNEFHSINYAILESPSFHFRNSSSQSTENVQNNLETDTKNQEGTSNENIIMDDASDVEITEGDNINQDINFSGNFLKNTSHKFDGNFGDDVKLLEVYPATQSNDFISPVKNASLHGNTTSHEVLICDSSSDSESSLSSPSKVFALSQQANDLIQNDRKPNFSIGFIENSPNISLNSRVRNKLFEEKSESEDSFVLKLPSLHTSSASPHFVPNASHEKTNVEITEIKIDGSEEDGAFSSERHSSWKKYKIREKFSSENLVSPSVSTCTQAGPSRLSSVSHEYFNDLQYECYEYYEPDVFSPPKNEAKKKSPPKKSPEKKSIKFAEVTHNNKSATPSTEIKPQFKLTDSPITPFPDYKSMVTPEIKEALKRIGVKALPRKKAIALLSHVYDETHPLMNGEMHPETYSPTKVSKTEKIKKRRKIKDDASRPSKKLQTEHHSSETTSVTQDSDDDSPENPKWQGCVPEISFTQGTQDSPTKPSKDDIDLIKQYIQSNEDLYNNVLTYVPLNLLTLQQELKDNGLKISIPKLMDFLDEQCITFTCPRKEEYRKKQTARTQRFRKNMIAKLSQQAS